MHRNVRLWTMLSLLIVFVSSGCRPAEKLPELYPLPSAVLTSVAGTPYPLDSLKGSVAIYDFIFTTCAGSCPLMTRKMKTLTEVMRDQPEIRFVSISVDPQHDRPEVLGRYAASVSGGDPRWTFLTGESAQIVDLSVKGFKLAAGGPGVGAEKLLHSPKFVLVDRRGMIRGYYDTNTPERFELLVKHARELAEND